MGAVFATPSIEKLYNHEGSIVLRWTVILFFAVTFSARPADAALIQACLNFILGPSVVVPPLSTDRDDTNLINNVRLLDLYYDWKPGPEDHVRSRARGVYDDPPATSAQFAHSLSKIARIDPAAAELDSILRRNYSSREELMGALRPWATQYLGMRLVPRWEIENLTAELGRQGLLSDSPFTIVNVVNGFVRSDVWAAAMSRRTVILADVHDLIHLAEFREPRLRELLVQRASVVLAAEAGFEKSSGEKKAAYEIIESWFSSGIFRSMGHENWSYIIEFDGQKRVYFQGNQGVALSGTILSGEFGEISRYLVYYIDLHSKLQSDFAKNPILAKFLDSDPSLRNEFSELIAELERFGQTDRIQDKVDKKIKKLHKKYFPDGNERELTAEEAERAIAEIEAFIISDIDLSYIFNQANRERFVNMGTRFFGRVANYIATSP